MSSMNTNTANDPSNLNTTYGMIGNNNNQTTSIANNGINETSRQETTFENTNLKTKVMLQSNTDGVVDNSNLKPSSGDAGMSSSSSSANNVQRTSVVSLNNNNGGGGGSVGDLNNNNINMNFLHMQNNNNAAMRGGGNNSDTDTDTTRRVSKDSLVSRESLSDLLSKATSGVGTMDQNSLAMLSMLASQQQMNNNQSFVNNSINQPMGQLFMNNNNNLAPNIHNPNAMLGLGYTNNTMNMNNNLPNAYAGSSLNNNNNTSLNPSKVSKKAKSNKKQNFAQKLMHLLSIKECQSCIRWMPNGMSFCIIDSNELVEKVLPKYFKEAKYTSFTRKLNRWGFKHFTLPKTEPVPEGGDREMSIYSHELFNRDNPDLCNQMDGGSKKKNFSQGDISSLNTGRLPPSRMGSMDTLSGGSSQGGGNNSMSIEQLQQQSLLIQQMQQIQRENMMMQFQQQLGQQQHGQQQQQQQQQPMNNPVVSSQQGSSSMQSMQGSSIQDPTVQSAINTMVQQQQQQDGTTTSAPNNNSGDTSSDWIKGIQDVVGSNRRTSLDMGYMNNPNRRTTVDSFGLGFMNNRRTTVESIGSFAVDIPIGMRRTSLGFMPYLPASNRRASGFSLGGFSNISNEEGDGLSPPADPNAIPTAVNVKVDMNDNADVNTAADAQGEGATSGDAPSQEEIRHCEAKLAVLEDMIAKEKQKRSELDPKSASNAEASS